MKVSLMWECDTCDNLRAARRCTRVETHAAQERKHRYLENFAAPPEYKDILSLKNDSRSPFSVLFREQN